jgi:hypothetical protein
MTLLPRFVPALIAMLLSAGLPSIAQADEDSPLGSDASWLLSYQFGHNERGDRKRPPHMRTGQLSSLCGRLRGSFSDLHGEAY